MPGSPTRTTYRHRLPVRIMHWVNVVCLFVLLLQRPADFQRAPGAVLGHDSDFDAPALSLTAQHGAGRQAARAAPRSARCAWTAPACSACRRTSTGVPMFAAASRHGSPRSRARRTSPKGRRWHFFFAWLFVINGLAYWLWSWRARHLRDDLLPTRAGLARHRRLDPRARCSSGIPTGEAATRYNVLQKLAYLLVIFVLRRASC